MKTIFKASVLPLICIAHLALLLAGALFSAQAEDELPGDDPAPPLSGLFQSQDTLNLRLEAPFRKFINKRGKERPYAPATLVYKGVTGQDVRVELKVRVRGNYRARKDVCRFPPLKLNFNKKKLKDTIFYGEDKLKLVTHCQPASKYEQYVLLEYINYRVQNLLTDYSLRARLAQIEYFDVNTNKVIDTKTAFFIEDIDRMVARVGAEHLQIPRIRKEDYDQAQLHLTTIFAYMLGNTDYSVIVGPPGKNCCHNIIPLRTAAGPLVPVAYDFDATGIVNAPYVQPSMKLGIRSMRERLYRGYCQNVDGFKQSFAPFLAQRDTIVDLYKGQNGLDAGKLASTLSYLESFYEAITNEEKIASEFVDKCRS